MIGRAYRVLKGLASSDPLQRVETLEKLAEWQLWRLPQEAVDRHLETPKRLPQAVLNGARLYESRGAMLSAIPVGSEIAEVGTLRGDFSRQICAVVKPSLFHLIDIDFSPFDWTGIDCEVVKHEGDSSTILASFPLASLDWVYVDGDHSYDSARKDLEAAHRALKPGALLTINDWTNWATLSVSPYGVAKATNELVIREGYSVEGLALDPYGNHDLLIRKP